MANQLYLDSLFLILWFKSGIYIYIHVYRVKSIYHLPHSELSSISELLWARVLSNSNIDFLILIDNYNACMGTNGE